MTLIDAIGTIGGALTTLCWLPQAIKAWSGRDTRAISLPMLAVLSVGVACWVAYGIGTGDIVVIGANAMSLVLIITVLAAKVRFG
jgi:MtN3 and saliva related transmembrane protein